jgi:TonB family protein
LILHALLAWVDLGLFKRPISTRDLPKAFIIDIFVPRTAKKSSVVKGPSIVVKEPILEKKIKRNVKRKPRIKPKSKDKERIQPPKKDETLANLPQVDLAAIHKEGGVLKEKHAFIPDMVDIPMAIGKIRDIPNRVKEEWLPDSVSNKPITYALPVYQKNTPPQYPLLARRRGYQGKVLLEVLVKKDGKVGSIRLARSSGYEILDSTAIKGVRNWLFHPAKRGDELVEMWVKIPIRFQLR